MQHKNFRLSDEDLNLLRTLACHHNISQSDVLRMGIREQARAAGIIVVNGKRAKGGSGYGAETGK